MQQLTSLVSYSNLPHYWSIVTHEGISGLTAVRPDLAATLSTCLAAHVTILCDTTMFLLIIHNHQCKIAIPAHIYPGTTHPYNILLDDAPVNDSRAFMAIIHKYL